MTHPIVEGMTEAVTMAKLMRENDTQASRIAELEAEVADLKLQLGMCDHSLHAAWNDAIEAAAAEADELDDEIRRGHDYGERASSRILALRR